MNSFITFYKSNLGLLKITVSDSGLKYIEFDKERSIEENANHPLLERTINQLDDYFNGARKYFDIPLDIQGTEFQKKVWTEVSKIEFGRTATYLEIAKNIGDKNAVRAVGLANGKNPIPIVIPCHRIIGSNGKLIGYGGGLWRKEWFLRHEGSILI